MSENIPRNPTRMNRLVKQLDLLTGDMEEFLLTVTAERDQWPPNSPEKVYLRRLTKDLDAALNRLSHRQSIHGKDNHGNGGPQEHE